MKRIIIFLLFFNLYLYADDETSDKYSFIRPNYLIDISINPGLGIYVGDFYDHLVKDGAYILTPVLDFYVSLFFIKYFGIQALISSGCVIHPYSEPIEGTILYMALELFGQYDFKYAYLKLFFGAGFQHTTMLLQYYASGFFEAGFEFAVRITEYIYINTGFRYRRSFLNSIIIYKKYDSLTENNTLSSIIISSGLTFRIKNWVK
jgi:hypothetical protein